MNIQNYNISEGFPCCFVILTHLSEFKTAFKGALAEHSHVLNIYVLSVEYEFKFDVIFPEEVYYEHL